MSVKLKLEFERKEPIKAEPPKRSLWFWVGSLATILSGGSAIVKLILYFTQ